MSWSFWLHSLMKMCMSYVSEIRLFERYYLITSATVFKTENSEVSVTPEFSVSQINLGIFKEPSHQHLHVWLGGLPRWVQCRFYC